MNDTQSFCLEQEMHTLLGVKQPGCVVLVFSDTSSVYFGLFLPLAENL